MEVHGAFGPSAAHIIGAGAQRLLDAYSNTDKHYAAQWKAETYARLSCTLQRTTAQGCRALAQRILRRARSAAPLAL